MLKTILEKNGITLTEKQIEQLLLFKQSVLEKNKVMNLTSITDSDEFDRKHFLDSLIILHEKEWQQAHRILDIGTGAGFPGVPLKIAAPDKEMILMDALKKRIVFLQELVKTLGLSDVCAEHGRAEEWAHKKEYRESCDLVISRAVARLNTLVEWAMPFVRVGGYFFSMKGPQGEEEWREAENGIALLGGKTERLSRLSLEGEDERVLIVIKKIKETPKKYPRGGGKPVKNPLK